MVVNIKAAVAAGAVGVASLFYLLYDAIVKAEKDLDEWKDNLVKEMKIDRLKLNKSLSFGTQTRRCDLHVDGTGAVRCQDLECIYGLSSFMLDVIQNAKKSVDVCIYIITADVFAAAIIDAKNRGLSVRVIADTDKSSFAESSINEFMLNDIPVRKKMSRYIMHHKFIVVDDEIVVTGSMNFTINAALSNWENVIVSSQTEIVDRFSALFQTLWEDFDPERPHI